MRHFLRDLLRSYFWGAVPVPVQARLARSGLLPCSCRAWTCAGEPCSGPFTDPIPGCCLAAAVFGRDLSTDPIPGCCALQLPCSGFRDSYIYSGLLFCSNTCAGEPCSMFMRGHQSSTHPAGTSSPSARNMIARAPSGVRNTRRPLTRLESSRNCSSPCRRTPGSGQHAKSMTVMHGSLSRMSKDQKPCCPYATLLLRVRRRKNTWPMGMLCPPSWRRMSHSSFRPR